MSFQILFALAAIVAVVNSQLPPTLPEVRFVGSFLPSEINRIATLSGLTQAQVVPLLGNYYTTGFSDISNLNVFEQVITLLSNNGATGATLVQNAVTISTNIRNQGIAYAQSAGNTNYIPYIYAVLNSFVQQNEGVNPGKKGLV